MIDVRLRSRIAPEELEQKVGKILTDEDYNLLLTRAARIRKPDGKLLVVYLPGALKAESEEFYPEFHKIRSKTDNRGLASGSVRVKAGATRSRAKPVESAILGSFDPTGSKQYCRLTAFTVKEGERWNGLRPFFQAVGRHFAEHVPDRYRNQMGYVERSRPEWVIPGTPFTTITVNNTYPTGVHTDKGDLDEGFSTLACIRRGAYSGGRLTFPEYRVAVDMQDGDLCLMDAHEWHGNTALVCECGSVLDGRCENCGAERISVVSYYRTGIAACGTMGDEDAKRAAAAEQKLVTA